MAWAVSGIVFMAFDVKKTTRVSRKNSAASNFYEMRRNLNFMARSFLQDALWFFHPAQQFSACRLSGCKSERYNSYLCR